MRLKRKASILNGAVLGCLSLLCYLIAFIYSKDSGDDSSLLLEFIRQERAGNHFPQSNLSLAPESTVQKEEENHSLHSSALKSISLEVYNLLSKRTGRSMARLEPYRLFAVLEEKLESGSSQKAGSVTEYSEKYTLMHHVTFPTEPPELIRDTHYIKRNPSSRTLVLGDEFSKWDPSSHQLKNVTEYFKYLHKTQSHCRKLVRLGGSLQCVRIGDDNNMDGNKLICLDPELELLRGRSPKDCLVFSFGVNIDVTFDESAALLPCETHMFDLLDYKPSAFLNDTPHAHFHQTGIGTSYSALFIQKKNVTLFIDTLVGHIMKNKLTARPMHILKMDIEGEEWKILKSLKGNPVLNLIGQIAIEVHAGDVVRKNMTNDEQIQYAQDRYDILREIEAHGFRMVAYWDNHQNIAYYDETGSRYDLCGELLYVNTNWYNATFKETLRTTYGFEFKAPP